MIKRIITGLALGIIMIASLIISIWSAAILFLIILIFCSVEWKKHFASKQGIFAGNAFVIAVGAFILLIFYVLFKEINFDLHFLNLGLIIILSTYALATILNREWNFCYDWYAGIFYICFSILVGFCFLKINFSEHRWVLLGFIIINWSNDVFAYFTGRLIGKHSLAPEISPKKTIEGSIGGLLAALITSFLVNEYLFINSYSLFITLILGFMIWLAGTTGDLYESKLKRLAGIKDSGNMLPGHGGFLDRFDSFLFVIPVGIFVISLH